MSWLYVILYFVVLGVSLAFMLLKMKSQTRFRWVQVLWCAPFAALLLFGVFCVVIGMIAVLRC